MEQHILDLVSRSSYKPLTPAGLARKLKVSKAQASVYRRTLARLIESGKLVETRNGRIRPRSAPGLIAGIVKRTSHGTGYLIPHEEVPGVQGDLYLRHNDIRDAHTGDEVLVCLLKRRGRGGRRCGRVEEVLVRATSTFVGTYFEESGQGYVQVDGTVLPEPVLVGDPGAKGAQPDDKVVIDMLRFPSLYQPGEAVLIRVLGPRGEPGVDTQSIIHEFGLPLDFPQAVLDESHQQADAFDEDDRQGRIDLTKETIVTIDPADARDFDDAISLSRSKDGHWHLGVHIADVSAFVLPGSPLDDEARKRGNSAYLPDTVIPMLPEVLSNGLASLQKGKVRYTKSALIEFTPEGIPVQTDLVSSVIKVTRRFAYEEVMPIVEEPDRFRSRVSAKVRVLLAQMHELAMLLRQRRRAAGALEMDLPEVKLEFDKQGR